MPREILKIKTLQSRRKLSEQMEETVNGNKSMRQLLNIDAINARDTNIANNEIKRKSKKDSKSKEANKRKTFSKNRKRESDSKRAEIDRIRRRRLQEKTKEKPSAFLQAVHNIQQLEHAIYRYESQLFDLEDRLLTNQNDFSGSILDEQNMNLNRKIDKLQDKIWNLKEYRLIRLLFLLTSHLTHVTSFRL